ncbi:MAG: hypothetical protein HC859_16630, partial [Bacteroidia bacterium]|nr:hypothetical protein [Bacteroidia bacterium]
TRRNPRMLLPAILSLCPFFNSNAAPEFSARFHFSKPPFQSPAKFACEVKNFDPVQFLDKKEARKIDRFTQLALVVSDQAMTDAGLHRDTLVVAAYFPSTH